MSSGRIRSFGPNDKIPSENLPSSSGGYDGDPTIIQQDDTHRFVSDAEKTTWNGKAAGNHNHDGVYSPVDHNHDASYAATGHNHTGVYAPVLGADDNYVTDAEKTKLANLSGINTGDQDLSGKQNTLVSGTNIKTINGNSLLGSGDLAVSGGGGGTLYTFSRVTGSNVTLTTQALADITGLSAALLANSVYEFEAVLSVQSSSTAGNGYGVNFSAAGATVEAQITGTLAAATQKTLRIAALNTAATPFVTVAATGGIVIKGIIVTGANPGNLTIKHLKVTSGTSTVFINSFLKTTKIA